MKDIATTPSLTPSRGYPRPGLPPAPARRAHRTRWLQPLLGRGIDIVAVALGVVALLGQGWLAGWYGLLVLMLLLTSASERVRLDPRIGDDVPRLVYDLGLPLLVLSPWLARSHEAPAVLHGALLLLLLLTAARLLTHAVVVALRRSGRLVEPTLIVGAGEVGQRLAEALLSEGRYGLEPIGFLEDNPYDRLPLPVLGGTEALRSVLERTGARRVIVAFGFARDSDMVSVLRACDDARVVMYMLPRFFELGFLPRQAEVDEVRGIPVVRLRRSALCLHSRILKRGFDLVLASAVLVLAAPIIAAVAIGVRLSSPGRVLFRQQRVGRNGDTFNLLKFRSMVVNSDSDTTWHVGSDPRVTRFGGLLRRTSLDELPQLWNVVCGDMSLVGPRPERPHFVEVFGESVRGYGDRHRVAAGMTGWSQIHGLRGDTSIADRAMFDNYYVENWSLWLDIRIIARTMSSVLHARSEPGDAGQAGLRVASLAPQSATRDRAEEQSAASVE